MYTRFFGLRENPFSMPPDPHYLYLSRGHQEALAHLQYGIGVSGGFGQLTGEVGTGKTLLIRTLVEELPDDVEVAIILYPVLTVFEFVAAICDELRVTYPRGNQSLKTLIDALNAHLLENHARGRRTILVIDEAQNLSREVLEQIRLLTNLETTKQKLLQIILIGQPELNTLLAQRDLRQLHQRITTRYHLTALSREETCDYMMHRCQVAGGKNPLLTRSAMRRVHKYSRGIPRLINVICERALMGAYAREKSVVDAGLVSAAAAEVGIKHHDRSPLTAAIVFPAVLGLALLLIGGWQLPSLFDLPFSGTEASLETVRPVNDLNESAAPGDTSPESVGNVLPDDSASSRPVTAGEISVDEAGVPPSAQLIALSAVPGDADEAFRGLFRRWGHEYDTLPGATACERAQQVGLRCIYNTGTWNNLRNYNRPAVIELVDSNDEKHHVLISAINGDSVTLELGGQSRDYAIIDIDQLWFGKYLLLWNPQRLRQGNLQHGVRGESVLWLREVLARYHGEPTSDERNDLFDNKLQKQVIVFQNDHHLLADGIVGELTMLQLNSYDREAPPILQTVASTAVK